MSRVSSRFLLSEGTTKLGKSILGWSVPAISTCPGKSSVCSRYCYATHGRFVTERVKKLMDWRYEQSKRKDFAEQMAGEIFRRGVLVCRVHVSGDFYSPSYTQKWIEIAARSKAVRFFAYSRSWRIEKIRPLLYAFGALPNVRLWLSADSDTGQPVDVPEGIRVAWLQHNEVVPEQAELVFQVRAMRGRVSLPTVCEQETPTGKARGVNCANCGVCWR